MALSRVKGGKGGRVFMAITSALYDVDRSVYLR